MKTALVVYKMNNGNTARYLSESITKGKKDLACRNLTGWVRAASPSELITFKDTYFLRVMECNNIANS